MNTLSTTLVNLIPIIFILIAIIFIFVAGLRYPHKHSRAYAHHLVFGTLTCLLSILVLVLTYWGLTEDGFATPIAMGLIIVGFLTFMSLLSISNPSDKEVKE